MCGTPRRLLPVVFLLLFASTCRAGGLGAHLGYGKANDADSGNVFVGAHLEVDPLPWLGVQGAIDYRNVETIDVAQPGENAKLDVKSVPITVTGRLYLPVAPRMRVFAAAGAGWYHLIYGYSGILSGISDKSDDTFGWHVGAGLQLQLAPGLAIFGEGRAIFVDPGRNLDGEVAQRVKSFDYNSTYFAAGLTLGI